MFGNTLVGSWFLCLRLCWFQNCWSIHPNSKRRKNTKTKFYGDDSSQNNGQQWIQTFTQKYVSQGALLLADSRAGFSTTFH